MADKPQPPEGITPEEYYLKWIPEQATANPEEAAKAAAGIEAIIQFVLTGDEGGDYYLEFTGGGMTTHKGKHDSPRLTITQSVQDWRDINSGKLNPQMAFMSGKLKVSGDMSLAMKLGSLMG